jgi:hypothetical protein
MTRSFALLLRVALMSSALLALARPAAADPLRCVVVYDQSGQPTSTVCVPGGR